MDRYANVVARACLGKGTNVPSQREARSDARRQMSRRPGSGSSGGQRSSAVDAVAPDRGSCDNIDTLSSSAVAVYTPAMGSLGVRSFSAGLASTPMSKGGIS